MKIAHRVITGPGKKHNIAFRSVVNGQDILSKNTVEG